MKKDLFIELVRKASKRSSMYTFADILDEESENLDIRAVSHRGFFAIINDFNAYYQANMSLVDLNNAGIFSTKTGRSTRTRTIPVRLSILKEAR